MKTILVTGFTAFGSDLINPSEKLVSHFHNTEYGDVRVQGTVLPVIFKDAMQTLTQLLEHYQPDAVLALGVANSRSVISLERVAINWIDARIKDNAGMQPVDLPVIDGAPAAYFTTLPIKRMHSALHTAGVASEISFSAGSYVCNAVFFSLMHGCATRGLAIPAGFVHVPPLPDNLHSDATPSRVTQTPIMGMEWGQQRLAIATMLPLLMDSEMVAPCAAGREC